MVLGLLTSTKWIAVIDMIKTESQSKAFISQMINRRIEELSAQYNKLYNDAEGHSHGMPEWYNHHDYASGQWKAKYDLLNDEFDFLNRLIDVVEIL